MVKVLWYHFSKVRGPALSALSCFLHARVLKVWTLHFSGHLASRSRDLFRFKKLAQDQKAGGGVRILLLDLAPAPVPVLAVTTGVGGCRSQPVLVTTTWLLGGKGIWLHMCGGLWNWPSRRAGADHQDPVRTVLPNLFPFFQTLLKILLLNPFLLKIPRLVSVFMTGILPVFKSTK